jgi:glycosyltransferase involved in cell wall biosynthesis
MEQDDYSKGSATLQYEPLPRFQADALQDDSAIADCCGKRVGILIVTYNAVTTLTKVLKRITPNVWKNVEEVVIFDDASADSTYELAMGIKASIHLPKLKVLKHAHNLGYGGNQKSGYQYFIERGFDVVVLLHGDGQYAPEILAHMYRPIVDGKADAVFGSRMMKTYGGPMKGGMPLYKYLGNRILTVFENAALGLDLTEFHSGYRAYNLHALKEIEMSKMTDKFHFDTEIIIKLHHQRFRILEVPIPTYYGDEICYVNGVKYAKDVFAAVRRYKQCIRSVQRHPEFEEYFVHYPIKHSQHSSHMYAADWVGSNNAVLDVGCGRGFLAGELVKNGNHVTGIDILPQSDVLPSLENYYQADLDNSISGIIGQLPAERFDRVLLLDILEHITTCDRLLRECRPALKNNGILIVSVPNIANFWIRLTLLLGRFRYTERGILDSTHVRFFTRKTARAFLEQNGYSIEEEKCTTIPLELIFGWSPDNPILKTLTRILGVITHLLPSLFGYQIMFTAKAA